MLETPEDETSPGEDGNLPDANLNSGKNAGWRKELLSKFRLWEYFSETSSCLFLAEGLELIPPSCPPRRLQPLLLASSSS